MVPHLKTLSEFADRYAVAPREAFDRQQSLMVLRGDADFVRSRFAKVQKATQGMAEGRQKLILVFREFRFHSG
jgi:hypothetical protein